MLFIYCHMTFDIEWFV